MIPAFFLKVYKLVLASTHEGKSTYQSEREKEK